LCYPLASYCQTGRFRMAASFSRTRHKNSRLPVSSFLTCLNRHRLALTTPITWNADSPFVGAAPVITVLPATPQHSSSDMASDVARAMRMNSCCETEPPALRDRCGFVWVIRNALRHVPTGNRQLLRQNMGAGRVKIRRRPVCRAGCRPLMGRHHGAIDNITRNRCPETAPTRSFSRYLYNQWLKVLKRP
jgi:hypothetical protein